MRLQPGKKASDGIDDIIQHPERYPMDCGEFVQVVKLYGMKSSMGDEAFNTYMEKQEEQHGIVVSNQESTGVNFKRIYRQQRGMWSDERDPKSTPIKSFNPDKEIQKI